MRLFEKNTLIKPFERSVLQRQLIMAKNDKGVLKTFKWNEKNHSTMKTNNFLPLYAEHLHSLITKAGWLVTKNMVIIPLSSQNLKKILSR